jgi:hypothetical protein
MCSVSDGNKSFQESRAEVKVQQLNARSYSAFLETLKKTIDGKRQIMVETAGSEQRRPRSASLHSLIPGGRREGQHGNARPWPMHFMALASKGPERCSALPVALPAR